MPSPTRSAKGVLSKEDAENIAVTYSPRKFPAVIGPTASAFHAFNSGKEDGGFRIDKLVALQTGVAELERLSIEERVEREALLRLKDLQEQAYGEAYQIGIEEGRQKSFDECKGELAEQMSSLESLLSSIERLKVDLIAFNETQIVRLIYYMAKRLVFDEVQARPELVLKCVQQAIDNAQSDENITLRVSPADMEFIENTREKLGKEFEGIKRAKLEASEEIESGGCIVETNYGDVNATLEQRLERLWEAVAEKLPKIKNVVGG